MLSSTVLTTPEYFRIFKHGSDFNSTSLHAVLGGLFFGQSCDRARRTRLNNPTERSVCPNSRQSRAELVSLTSTGGCITAAVPTISASLQQDRLPLKSSGGPAPQHSPHTSVVRCSFRRNLPVFDTESNCDTPVPPVSYARADRHLCHALVVFFTSGSWNAARFFSH